MAKVELSPSLHCKRLAVFDLKVRQKIRLHPTSSDEKQANSRVVVAMNNIIKITAIRYTRPILRPPHLSIKGEKRARQNDRCQTRREKTFFFKVRSFSNALFTISRRRRQKDAEERWRMNGNRTTGNRVSFTPLPQHHILSTSNVNNDKGDFSHTTAARPHPPEPTF